MDCLSCIFIVYLVAILIYGLYSEPGKRKVRAGEPCGPSHRWMPIGTPLNNDLSCEKDRAQWLNQSPSSR
jgi:hypothetical protein